jgi:hypothetical protein
LTKWDGISHSPDVGTAGIAFRLWTWAALLRVLKHVVPLATLVRMMHARPRRVAPVVTDDIERYLHTSGRFPRRPPGNCLERSLGVYRLLCQAGASPELLVGMRRLPSHPIEGHVWVRAAGRPIGETAASLHEFQLTASFDEYGRRTPASPTGDRDRRSA